MDSYVLNEVRKTDKKITLYSFRFCYLLLFLMLFLSSISSVYLIIFVDPLVYKVFGSVLLGLTIIQFGFLVHDTQHGQVFTTKSANKVSGFILSNLICGISYAWWGEKHITHHKNPNNTELDPDIYPQFSYSAEEAVNKSGIYRFIAKYQAYFYVLIVMWSTCYFRYLSIRYLIAKPVKWKQMEIVLLSFHHSLYAGIFLLSTNFTTGLCLLLISYIVSGIYMAFIFTPNHMGMPINIGLNDDVLKPQIESTRNVRAGLITDFVFGGLNYQIEHHLYPKVSRFELAALSTRVKEYCNENSFHYHEVTVVEAYKEIFSYLHGVGSTLRGRKT